MHLHESFYQFPTFFLNENCRKKYKKTFGKMKKERLKTLSLMK